MEYELQQDHAQKTVKAMKKSGKLIIAVAGVALGGLLLFLGSRGTADREAPADEILLPTATPQSTEEYRVGLEMRMEDLCRRVAGVGEVEIAVTLEGGFAYVYATDTKITAGGESTTYVTVGSGADKSLVYVTERPPLIAGIGVVCTGGNRADVRQEVISLLSAAFGVGSNKIYVTGQK